MVNSSEMASPLDDPFRLYTTPATLYTREIGFAVKVSTSVDTVARLPILGDTYGSASAFHSQTRISEYGNYICTKAEDGGEGYFWYFFSKNKTAPEAAAPFKNPEENFGNHYWPPILKAIDILRNAVPKTANTGNSVYSGWSYSAVPIFVPSADTGTLFVLREMLGPTSFGIPQWPTPMSSSVSFNLPNSASFSFPECLHDDISIDGLQDLEQIYATVGAAITNRVGLVNLRSFPATNFKTWLPYFLYDRQTRTATGAYHRTQMEVVPPPLPKAQRGR